MAGWVRQRSGNKDDDAEREGVESWAFRRLGADFWVEREVHPESRGHFRAGVRGHWLELVVNLLERDHEQIILLPGGAPVVLIEVEDKRGEV